MRSWILSLGLLFGLVFVYVGERIFGAGTARTVLSSLGCLAVLGVLVARALRTRGAVGEWKLVERDLLTLHAGTVLGLLVYFLQSDLVAKLVGKPLEQDAPKIAGVLGALWPAVLIIVLLSTLMTELSYASMANATRVEERRVRDAMLTGLGLGGAVVFAFAAMYVANVRDTKWDLSYFRTTKVGDATRKIAQSLDEAVTVATFFPPGNEVAEQVKNYLDDLRKDAPQLKVEPYDHAVDPTKARELGVSANGAIVLTKGARREQLLIGLELEKARGQLRILDQELQKKLMVIARTRRTVYVTIGHGERRDSPAPDAPQGDLSTIAALKELLRSQNYDLRDFGVSDGLGHEVPKDAAAVLVVGPKHAFEQPEVDALNAYVARGGRLLVALDAESKQDFKPLLSTYGLTFTPDVLANDEQHGRRTFQNSDRTIIASQSYSSHAAVTRLGRTGLPMVFIGAGFLDATGQAPAEVSVDIAVRSHPRTWNDLNGNFEHDAPEKEVRKGYGLGAAVTRRAQSGKPDDEGRAIVLADADALSDFLLERFPGNRDFVLDTMKWLLGDEAIVGTPQTEEDVYINRTKGQDMAWTYSTMAVLPGAAILVGFLVRRRKGKPGPRDAQDVPRREAA